MMELSLIAGSERAVRSRLPTGCVPVIQISIGRVNESTRASILVRPNALYWRIGSQSSPCCITRVPAVLSRPPRSLFTQQLIGTLRTMHRGDRSARMMRARLPLARAGLSLT